MRTFGTLILGLGLFVLAVAVAAPREATAVTPGSAAHFQRQLDLIQRQENSRGPYAPVTLTAADADAWFASTGAAHLPEGISDLHFSAQPDILGGSAEIDFDRLTAHGLNQFLSSLFSGRHQVAAQAHLDSVSGGQAHFTVTTVAIDGQTVPNLLVDTAIRAFIQPRHPDIGRQFAVPLPDHVTTLHIGAGWVRLEY